MRKDIIEGKLSIEFEGKQMERFIHDRIILPMQTLFPNKINISLEELNDALKNEIIRLRREETNKLLDSSELAEDPISQPPKIHPAPLPCLRSIARFLFTKKTVDQIFSQLIEDAEEEYFEALLNNESAKAKWIRIRSYLIFTHAFSCEVMRSVFKFLKSFSVK